MLSRNRPAISIQDASEAAPTLSHLMALARQSQAMLVDLLPLIPVGLHPLVGAGGLDAGTWCLLVQGNACAAKLRQLSPALLSALRQKGWQVTAIRIKIQAVKR